MKYHIFALGSQPLDILEIASLFTMDGRVQENKTAFGGEPILAMVSFPDLHEVDEIKGHEELRRTGIGPERNANLTLLDRIHIQESNDRFLACSRALRIDPYLHEELRCNDSVVVSKPFGQGWNQPDRGSLQAKNRFRVGGDGFLPFYDMRGRANRRRMPRHYVGGETSILRNYRYAPRDIQQRKEMEAQRREAQAFARACREREEVEAATQPDVHKSGRYGAHDSRGKSSRALLHDFRRLIVQDEFARDTLEESIDRKSVV